SPSRTRWTSWRGVAALRRLDGAQATPATPPKPRTRVATSTAATTTRLRSGTSGPTPRTPGRWRLQLREAQVEDRADRERQHDDQRPGVVVEVAQLAGVGAGQVGQAARVEPDDGTQHRHGGDQG